VNLATLADEQAARFGDRVLALVDGERVTYGGLVEGAGRFAAGLRELGIERGDRVAIMMANRPEFLYAWFGILKLGAIEVPIHNAARGPGIAHILETTGARALIVEEDFVPHVDEYVGSLPGLEQVIATGPAPDLGKPASAFADLLATAATVETTDVEPRQPASILFTGGTTGPPKGVMLPHNHNLNVATGVAELVEYTADDVLLSVFPLFHANAKYTTVVAAMVVGARVVLNRRFSARGFWDLCRREGVTAFNGQGEMLRILLKQPERAEDGANSVRVVYGAAAPEEVVVEFERRFGVSVLDVYGMTETGPITSCTFETRRAGSCGVAVPWYDVRVVDEHDLDVAEGEKGEIVVRPRRPHVMMEGYWMNEGETLKSLRNLWFHTGDHARRDADGFFWFAERATDSIRRRGENVSAWEVERVLADHPRVLEAAVYGVPSELGGQEVMVAVVKKPDAELTPEELLDFCTGKMPHFAVPRFVRFVDGLPKSHAQRILKQDLKAEGVDAPDVWDRELAGYEVLR
jgi:crotonobetaine/carnitine-CoA ligase